MRLLFDHLNSEQADLCTLILSASGIVCTAERSGKRWAIWVDEDDVGPALEKVAQYFRENPERPPVPALSPGTLPRTFSGIYAALMLMLVYWAEAYHGVAEALNEKFGALSGRIMEGELYRTVTALMLHSDIPHLVGNMAGIALFGTAVAWATRPGVGWLLILLTGILGNLANAALQNAGHHSIGASTAVFGAIGLLSAFQFWDKYRHPGYHLKAWLPLAGGLALLGVLGTAGERTDLMAHLLGMLSGCVIGTAYSLFIPEPLSNRKQMIAWCLTSGILLSAWFQGR